MSNIFSESLEERKKVAAKVGKACREVGFFYAVNHGVSQEAIETAFSAIAAYFAQPEKVKLETHIHNNKHFRGYEPLLETRLDPSTRGGMSNAIAMQLGLFSHVRRSERSIHDWRRSIRPRMQRSRVSQRSCSTQRSCSGSTQSVAKNLNSSK